MLKSKPILGALIEKINAAHPMTKLDVGEYSEIKAPMMRFEISAYKAEGLGHVSVMSMSGMLGLMKMDTVIINPTDRDLPLFSYDRVYAAGNDTFIVELYDTMANPCEMTALGKVKADAADLPPHDLGEHWYNSIKLPESLSFKGQKSMRLSLTALRSPLWKRILPLKIIRTLTPVLRQRSLIFTLKVSLKTAAHQQDYS